MAVRTSIALTVLLAFAIGFSVLMVPDQTARTPKEMVEVDPVAEDARLVEFLDAMFMDFVNRSPESQTYLGIKTDYGKWTPRTDEFAAADHELTKQYLADLKAEFDPDNLTDEGRLNYDLALYSLEQDIAGYKWRDYSYPVNQMFGAQQEIPSFLINIHQVTDVSDAEAYISRLNGIEELLGQVIVQMKAREELGVLPPKFVFPKVLDDSRNVITGAPFDDGEASPLWADFTKKVDALELDDPAVAQDLKDRAQAALLGPVQAGFLNLIATLEDQQGRATTDDGVWKLPDGEAYYAHRLKTQTTTDLTADEIHQIGLDEVARIHGEIREIMKEVEFDGTLEEFFTFMREDEQFYYPNTDEGRDAYLQRAKAVIADMKTRLDGLFNIKPQASLEVKRVEPFREKSGSKAFYQPPAPDGSRPGRYFVNLYDMNDQPIYQIEALAYHEGIPGHHMQIALQQEQESLPMLRQFGGQTAYIEGWGLYSELLPKEIGLYKDPYQDFGRLSMELYRAMRLVVDTGLHAKKWTREQAIEYFKNNSSNADGDSEQQIERYIVLPAQATAYKIGMIKILELREAARAELGDAFDIRGFHDVVLANGSVPLDVLEDLVDDWVAETKIEQAS